MVFLPTELRLYTISLENPIKCVELYGPPQRFSFSHEHLAGGELLTEPFRIAFPHLSCEETGEEAAWVPRLVMFVDCK